MILAERFAKIVANGRLHHVLDSPEAPGQKKREGHETQQECAGPESHTLPLRLQTAVLEAKRNQELDFEVVTCRDLNLLTEEARGFMPGDDCVFSRRHIF